MEEVLRLLRPYADEQMAAFSRRLIPTATSQILGLKTPQIREVARLVSKDPDLAKAFLDELPHQAYEEYQVHSFLLAKLTSLDEAFSRLDSLLEYADSWAVTDSIKIPLFSKNLERVHEKILCYLASDREYTRRYAIVTLMCLFLEDSFQEEDLHRIAALEDDRYYVNMARAWYFCEALIKQYDSAVALLEQRRLCSWVANMTIQKAIESFRIAEERKSYLRTLKIR
jgi:3-methyladenine DNA glycosylase AlkD